VHVLDLLKHRIRFENIAIIATAALSEAEKNVGVAAETKRK
jgi:hypothetical protein